MPPSKLSLSLSPLARKPDPGERLAPGRQAAAHAASTGQARADARKPHICFVAPAAWPFFSGDRHIPVVGGAEVQQGLIAPALAERGYRVSMITLDYGQPEPSLVKGVRVYKFCKPDEGIPVVRFLHPRLTSLWRALRRVNADIYYTRSAAPVTGFVAAFCKRHGKRAIYSGASDADFVPGGQDITYARDRWIFEFGLRHSDRLFAQNPTQQERLERNYGLDSVLVPNSYVPPPGARGDPRGYVLWVASIRAQKQPEILIEIARRLPQHRFVMVGGPDGGRKGEEYGARIRAAAEALPNCEYRGFLPYAEADRVFDGARVVVGTSSYEGFPNTFLQAWSRGVPTVAFVDTRSRRPDGEPVYDIVADVDEATRAVDRLMTEDIAWHRASQRVAAHFHESHSLDAVMAVYEREIARLVPHE